MIFTSGPVLAVSLDSYNLALLPYWGTGSVNHGGKVNAHQGIVVQGTKLFALGETIGLGPAMEVGESWLTTSDRENSQEYLATYDNKFLKLGGHMELKPFRAQSRPTFFLNILTGRGQAQLQTSASHARAFVKQDYQTINTQLLTASLGARIPLRKQVSLLVAANAHRTDFQTANAKASAFSGDIASKKGRAKLTGDTDASSAALTNTPQTGGNIRHQGLTISTGFAVSF